MRGWGIITGFVRGEGILSQVGRGLSGRALLVATLVVPGIASAAAPVIDSFEATPAAVKPGGAVALAVQAYDPDCSGVCTSGCGMYIRADLTQWSAPAGSFDTIDNGASGSPYAASAVWTAPAAEGEVTITVTLSDSGTFICGGRQTVSGDVVVQVSATAGQEPVITALTVDPPQVLTGTGATLTATAVDPQGDPITFSWSADLGTVTGSGGGAAAYTAPPAPAVVTVNCTASDPGGASSSRLLTFPVTDVRPEVILGKGLRAPHDVAANVWGDLLVVDAAAGGLTVVGAVTGEILRSVRLPGATSVEEDWLGRIVVGTEAGVLLLGHDGSLLGSLVPPSSLGPVTDVAIDPAGGKIWVLYGEAARVVAFDATGAELTQFGGRGAGTGQLQEPVAMAWSPAGELLIADAAAGQVLAFTPGGVFLRSMGGLGGAAGEFTRVGGVVALGGGVTVATDTFQSRIQSFNADGSLREVFGIFGKGLGELDTPVGIARLDAPPRLAVASANAPNVQVFSLDPSAAVVPEAVATPAHLDLGSVTVGEVSDPQVAVLRNTGAVPVGLYGIDRPGPFAVQTTCGAGLAPGQSCTATVTFAPFRDGRVVGPLRFRCGGAGDQVVTLEARGVAVQAARAAVSVAGIDFGAVPVGSVSTARAVSVSNIGGGLLEIAAVSLEGASDAQFRIVSDACTGASLAPGSACAVTVAFAPTALGAQAADLTVASNSVTGRVTVALDGEGVEAVPIPTQGGPGVVLLILMVGLAGALFLRRKAAVLGFALVLLAASAAGAADPPHWYFGIDCSSCHTGHNAAGGNLTVSAGNVNLCQSCHNPGGLASRLPVNSSDVAQPGVGGTSHGFDVAATSALFGALPPNHAEMSARVMGGNVVCSTCHDQHASLAATGGRVRVSPPERLTALGSTGSVTTGGTFTGTAGASYLIEITMADSRFRYSKDAGTTWMAEQNLGAGVALDSGITVTFSGGSFAVGERWRFTAAYPFLRAKLDEGANAVGDAYCRDCHRQWVMDHSSVESYNGAYKSHPVGQALGANGRGYDRTAPLDGNGAVQGGGGGDGVASSDLRLDAGGLVQCISCHGVHFADSNTQTEDGR